MVENTEKDASKAFFFLTQFVFFRTFVYLNDETLFKNTQDENISLVVRVALKKMRILLYYYYSYYY